MRGRPWSDAEVAAVRTMYPNTKKWAVIEVELPGRTRDTIRQKAVALGLTRDCSRRIAWSADEDNAIRRLWPTADQPEIEHALPRRAWGSIQRRAVVLRVLRGRPETRGRNLKVHPLIKQLRVTRYVARMSRPVLSKKIGHHVNQILNWENGKAQPGFHAVADWADALGFELVLRRKAEVLLRERPAVARIERMMAGR